MSDPSEFPSIRDALRALILELDGTVDHVVLSKEDAEEDGLPLMMDDATGLECFDIEGVRVFIDPECPPGEMGFCFLEPALGTA